MNKIQAKSIAETVTNEQLREMLLNAQSEIIDWKQASTVNIGMSKGIAFNVFTAGFDVNKPIHIMAKVNMIREFGEFLPGYEKPKKNSKAAVMVSHQEPNLFH